MIFTVYKKNTGEIIKTGICVDEDIDLQITSDESYVEGIYSHNLYYIENNKPVLIPESPNPCFVFNYNTKQWYDPRTNKTEWVVVRNQRNVLLASSDWTQLPDVEINTKLAWSTYRQSLRDITTQPDPLNIIWPTPPQG